MEEFYQYFIYKSFLKCDVFFLQKPLSAFVYFRKSIIILRSCWQGKDRTDEAPFLQVYRKSNAGLVTV